MLNKNFELLYFGDNEFSELLFCHKIQSKIIKQIINPAKHFNDLFMLKPRLPNLK